MMVRDKLHLTFILLSKDTYRQDKKAKKLSKSAVRKLIERSHLSLAFTAYVLSWFNQTEHYVTTLSLCFVYSSIINLG